MKKLLLLLLLFPISLVAQTATINGGTVYQTIDGFGGENGGGPSFTIYNTLSPSQANAFFSTTPGIGIGLSFYRTNSVDGTSSTPFPDLQAMQTAVAYGVPIELVISGPPSSMQYTGSFSNGGANPSTGNCLASGVSYSTYATYLVGLVQNLSGNGVPVKWIDVQQEPVTSNNGFGACVANAAFFDNLVPVLHSKLATAGFTPSLIIGDAYPFNNAVNYFNTCLGDSGCAPYVAVVSGHGYPYPNWANGDGVLYSGPIGQGKHVWQSETTDNEATSFNATMSAALPMAEDMAAFISQGQVSAYEWWEIAYINNGGDCQDCQLVDQNFDLTKRYYAMGNWSLFVRPGWQMISATYQPQSGVQLNAFKAGSQFAIVAVNTNSGATSQTFALSGLSAPNVTPYITDPSNNLAAQSPITISGGSFTASLTGTSVTTFVSNQASGCNINANSLSQTDVQAAFNAVTASTCSVTLPPGTATWLPTSGTVSLTVPSGNSALTVQGSSACTGQGNPGGSSGGLMTCTDGTLITDGSSSVPSNDPALFSVTGTAGNTFTLKGISIAGPAGTTITYNGALIFNPNGGSMRITQTHFSNLNSNTADLYSAGCTSCVVDHSLWTQGNASVLWHIKGATGADQWGNNSWAAATAFGTTAGWWYFEDNEFQGGSSDCDYGGKFASRYNTWLAETGTAQFFLTHPTGEEPGGAIRGCRATEWYGNAMDGNGHNYIAFGNFMQSGTSLFWGNSSNSPSTTFDFVWALRSVRQTASGTYTQQPWPTGWGYCGTAYNGTGSPWDQNANTSSGYRCLDQPGTGQSQLLSGSFPNVINTSTGNAAWPEQASEPIYDWQNSITPNDGYVYNEMPTAMFQNTDYYLWCHAAATTGCTSFNGTQGVGSGSLAAAPSGGTQNVGYFATDQGNWNSSGIGGQGVLYRYNGSGTLVPYATPLAYPHPLVGGTVPLTVTITGTGSGTVSGTNCSSGAYTSGTLIGTCTASASSGTFTGWSGPCTGTGTCAQFALNSTTTLTAIFSAQAATPIFSLAAGAYAFGTNVTLTSTGGCSAYLYWGTASPPTSNAATFPITVNATYYAQVIGCPGYTNSAISSAAYTVTSTPGQVFAGGILAGTVQ